MKLRATRPQSVIGAYKRSKLMAEREVERLVSGGRTARRDRGAVHAHRPARHQAHAHRPHHRRSGDRAHAGLCRYRPQSGACGRCRAGPSPGAGTRQDRRELHSGRRRRAAADHAGRHRLPVGPRARPKSNCPARRFFRWPVAREAVGARHRQGAVSDRRCAAHVALPHVLLVGEGRARAGLYGAALQGRPEGCAQPGSAPTDICNDRWHIVRLCAAA